MAAPVGRIRGLLRALWSVGVLALPAALSVAAPARLAQAQMLSDRYAAIVVDHSTGAVLHAEQADERRYPASLTKMMTLYMAFEALRDRRMRPNQMLTVSAAAAAQPPSKLGLVAGQRISLQQAIMALVTKSANDAAVVVAEAIAGSEEAFAARMTVRARALGMSRTTFRNASGLPDRAQITTARDMATLGRRLLTDFPQYYRYFSTHAFRFRDRTLQNHNRLLASYEGMDGIKTGFINDSGFNLVASARRGNTRLVAAVFGGPTARERDAHMVDLLDRGFGTTEVRIARARPPRGGGVLIASAAAAPLARPVSTGDVRPVAAGGRGTELYYPQRGPATRENATGGSRNWSIQVGVFSARPQASRAATEAKTRLGSRAARPLVIEMRLSGRTAYRARLAGFTESQARAACAQLQRRGNACVPLRNGTDGVAQGRSAPRG
ncbi:MAG: D-alanyl-D-alanine carboxypeptidase [Alphaproteobacteria bacterium]|nr:D-alanyl-D-alanine carboxypeptidase [Alphaproteobacteria bacterium]